MPAAVGLSLSEKWTWGHHTINCLGEIDVERGSARRSSLKGLERAIVSQTNIETASRATDTSGKLQRDSG